MKSTSIEYKIDKLKTLIKKGVDSNYFNQLDFKDPATEKELLDLENKIGTYLPEDYREFCLKISKGGPCPDTPLTKKYPELNY